MMAVRLVELDPDDGAAAAAASGWLSRAGRPVDAVYYAKLAFEHGHPVNVATNSAPMTRWMRAVRWRLPRQSALSCAVARDDQGSHRSQPAGTT